MFKTEADFSRSLSTKLKNKGIDITRIESHGTGNGIPDMFIQAYGWDAWLELKNDPKDSISNNLHKIAWRPGQQAWMLNYFLKHAKKRCCLTIQACSDGVLIIPHTSTILNNIHVGPGMTWEEFQQVNIRQLIRVLTDCETYAACPTYRSAINYFMENEYGEIDYDPEVLWEAETIDNMFDLDIWQRNLLDVILQLRNYQK